MIDTNNIKNMICLWNSITWEDEIFREITIELWKCTQDFKNLADEEIEQRLLICCKALISLRNYLYIG